MAPSMASDQQKSFQAAFVIGPLKAAGMIRPKAYADPILARPDQQIPGHQEAEYMTVKAKTQALQKRKGPYMTVRVNESA